MKTSVSLFISDILPRKRKLYHKVVKNDIINGLTADDAFIELKKGGLDGIEIILSQYAETTNEDIHDILTLTRKHHLRVFSVHQALRFFTPTRVPEIDRLAEIAQKLHAPVIVLHINAAGKQIFQQEYVDALHEIEKKYHVTVTFENMERYFGSIRQKHRWDGAVFSNLVKKNNFGITFDVVHLAHSGGNILSFFKQNKDRIKNIHLSDYRYNMFNSTLRPMRYKHMPLGEGDLPLTQFLDLLRKEKYQGLVTMEIHTNLKGICESAAIINKVK